MENWYGAALCKEARNRSRGAEKIKLSAIHIGISVGVMLAVSLICYFLDRGIAQTGGLSGMGMRSILQTASTLLINADSVLTPFWNLGFLYVTLLWVRGQRAQVGDLLTGFRRFGAYLRLMLNRMLLTIAGGFLSIYAGAYLYMMTPWAEPVIAFAEASGMDMEAASEMVVQMDLAQVDGLFASMIPMMIISAVLCVLILAPMLYKFRMAEYFLLENRQVGTLRAMFASAQMMRKRRFKLFLLDLRFWWYYVLQSLCLVVYCADLWLPLFGVTLPEGVMTTVCLYGLYVIGLLLLQTFLRPQVMTAYALAYEKLLHMEPELPVRRPPQQNLPWNEQ